MPELKIARVSYSVETTGIVVSVWGQLQTWWVSGWFVRGHTLNWGLKWLGCLWDREVSILGVVSYKDRCLFIDLLHLYSHTYSIESISYGVKIPFYVAAHYTHVCTADTTDGGCQKLRGVCIREQECLTLYLLTGAVHCVSLPFYVSKHFVGLVCSIFEYSHNLSSGSLLSEQNRKIIPFKWTIYNYQLVYMLDQRPLLIV